MLKRGILLSSIIVAGLISWWVAPGQAQRPKPPGAEYTGAAFSFNKIADGIYHAVGNAGTMSVGCNASVIVNPDDVLIVDSHASPAAAWALMEEIKAFTNKPVKFVVNTHFHWDHAHGNQIYGLGVEIIGSEFTRNQLVAGASKTGRSYPMFITQGIPAAIDRIKGQQATAADDATKQRLAEQLKVQQNYMTATGAVTITPPTVTLKDSLTLYRGGREIRLMFLGRGHTGGDVVVYLPKERVMVTGDLMTNGTSYIGDGYVPDWIETLNKLKAIDFDWVLPGHGAAFQGKAKIDQFQSYLRDFWSQAEKLHKAGVPAAEAAKQIDLRSHAADFPSITAAGILDHGVFQAYDIMEGKIK